MSFCVKNKKERVVKMLKSLLIAVMAASVAQFGCASVSAGVPENGAAVNAQDSSDKKAAPAVSKKCDKKAGAKECSKSEAKKCDKKAGAKECSKSEAKKCDKKSGDAAKKCDGKGGKGGCDMKAKQAAPAAK